MKHSNIPEPIPDLGLKVRCPICEQEKGKSKRFKNSLGYEFHFHKMHEDGYSLTQAPPETMHVKTEIKIFSYFCPVCAYPQATIKKQSNCEKCGTHQVAILKGLQESLQ